MDSQVYKEHIEQEETHWWFVSRRNITSSLLKKLNLPKNAKILDAGCGAGGNLPLLAEYGEVFGSEMNDEVRNHSISRNIGTIAYGKLPDEIPFKDTKFDLIAMFDVLEHIEDDRTTLAAITNRLTPNGQLLITIPAFQFLFSEHDIAHHHFRRYSKKEIVQKVKEAGLTIEYINYWNFFLFPIAIMARLTDFLRPKNSRALGRKTPPYFVNQLLIKLVSSERFLNPKIPLPFGLSLMVVARKILSNKAETLIPLATR